MPPPPTAPLAESGERQTLLVFAATLVLSAFLLFSVQPMVAKMLLPVLGGAPATWAVSLTFFQALLLLGYAYAHLLNLTLGGRRALIVHAAVLVAAFAATPVALPADLGPPASPYLWLLATLAAVAGLPFFALSANAPLLQAWFGRSGHPLSADPYFLYGASNAGSLAALLAYPTVIEPLLPLSWQSRIWSAAFLLLVLAIVGCGLIALRPDLDLAAGPSEDGKRSRPPSWGRRMGWIFLAFVPSGLLVAYTTYLTTDLASAPLLWVLPLALYLATFIVAFRARQPIGPRHLLRLQPLALAAALAAQEWKGDLSWVVAAVVGLMAFLITSLLCHGRLYRRRPDRAHLTNFYLCLSVGGVLGGVFAAILAPLLFTGTSEFPLLLGLGLLAHPKLWRALSPGRRLAQLALLVGAGLAAILLLAVAVRSELFEPHRDLRLGVICGLGLAAVLATPAPRLATAALAAMIAATIALPSASAPIYVTRSFFGTHRVIDSAAGDYRLLLHGTTLHGLQQNRSGAALVSRPIPLAYYHPTGPLARALNLARGATAGPLRVGIVGLGTGAMACYAAADDHWRFFEIDAAIVHIATTPSLFRYIARCLPAAEIVLGDARLTLARQNDGAFDFLMVDAFSSDAIPMHLITVEALRLYLNKLADRGILALHVSNQNLDLPPVLEANLAALSAADGVAAQAVYVEGERGSGALASQVVLMAHHRELLEPALAWHRARRLDQPRVRPWTDDYSDFVSALWRRYRAKFDAGLKWD